MTLLAQAHAPTLTHMIQPASLAGRLAGWLARNVKKLSGHLCHQAFVCVCVCVFLCCFFYVFPFFKLHIFALVSSCLFDPSTFSKQFCRGNAGAEFLHSTRFCLCSGYVIFRPAIRPQLSWDRNVCVGVCLCGTDCVCPVAPVAGSQTPLCRHRCLFLDVFHRFNRSSRSDSS